MKPKERENNIIELTFMLLFLLLGVLLGYVINNFNSESKITYAFQNGTFYGINQTLSNTTLMLEVANKVNIAYVNQYGAIPIYIQTQTPLGIETKVYQCTNISQVKQ